MFFRDMIESAEQWAKYEKLISDLSQFVADCVRYLMDAYTVTQVGSVHDQAVSAECTDEEVERPASPTWVKCPCAHGSNNIGAIEAKCLNSMTLETT